MTRREAIEWNKNLKMYMKLSDRIQPCKFPEDNYIALDMAIQALEQDPCEDMISRRAVMDCFKKWQPYMATRLHEFEKELSALPPVAPEPKRRCQKGAENDKRNI